MSTNAILVWKNNSISNKNVTREFYGIFSGALQLQWLRALSILACLQLILGSTDNWVLVTGANTPKIIQGQIHDRHTAECFRLDERGLVAGGVRVFVSCPDSFFISVAVVWLISVATVLLGRITDASKSTCTVFSQSGAHLRVRQQSWFISLRSWSACAVGHDGRHTGNLTVGCQLPSASVSRDADNDLATRSTVLQPIPEEKGHSLSCEARVEPSLWKTLASVTVGIL